MAETVKQPPEIFDRKRRRLIKTRSLSHSNGQDFLNTFLAEEIVDRLQLVTRSFEKCLVIGPLPRPLEQFLLNQKVAIFIATPAEGVRTQYTAVQCDEDRLPFKDGIFDLVVSVGCLDSVNDLPGTLLLIQRILVPDGLFMAAFTGAESLTLTKNSFIAIEGDSIGSHVHPQIDVRTAGDLMTRAGFALPVADSAGLNLRYSTLSSLLNDIRSFGGSNVLTGSKTRFSKKIITELEQKLLEYKASDGKFTEKLEIISICGWAPHPEQPLPARRGSANILLHTVLDNKKNN